MHKIISICLVTTLLLFFSFAAIVQAEETDNTRYKAPEMKGYTYNLKQLLEKTEQNLKEVDKKLKEEEVEKQNEERDAVIRKHFEEGNQLYQEGKFKEAKQQWQKALEISKDPEMKGYIKKAESKAKEEELARKKEEQKRQKQLRAEAKEKKRVKREKQKQLIAKQKEQKRQLNEQAKTIYNEAVSLYRARNYQQAQTKFEQISELIPNYAGTDSYLRHISQDIQKEKERLVIEKQQQEEVTRKEQERKQKQEQAQLEKKQKEKQRLEAQKTREEKLARAKEINSIYRKAVSSYNKKQIDKASSLFKQILSLDPEHRKAKDYLNRKIPAGIKQLEIAKQREEKRMQTAEQKRFKKQAQEKQETKKKVEIKPQQKKPQLNKQAKTIYDQAISLYRAKKYEQAQEKFKQVAKIYPNYSRTDSYLSRIPKYIQEGKERKQKEEQKKLEKEKREKELAQKREFKGEINSLYKQATTYYKNNQFDQAKDAFNKILSLDSGHRGAKDYLGRKIPNRIKQLEVAKQREEKHMQTAKQKRSQKQIQEKETTSTAKEPENKLNETARAIYKEAVSLYSSGKYTQAKEKFEQLKQIEPNYPNVDYYLERIPQKAIERKEYTEAKNKQEEKMTKRKKIASLSNKAVSFYDQGKLPEAAALFKQILSLDPTNKKAIYYLEYKLPRDVAKFTTAPGPKAVRKENLEPTKERIEVEKMQKAELARKEAERKQKQEQAQLEKEQKEKQRLEAQKTREEKLARAKEINSIHKKAIAFYNQNKFDEASSLFVQILSLDPGNRRAKYYLEKNIPNRIKKIQETEKKKQEYKLKKEKAAEEKKLKEEQRRLETEKRNAERKKEKTNDKTKEMLKRKEAEQQKRQKQADKKQLEKINRIYGKAVSLYKQDKLSEAKVLLFDILSLDPTESGALDYINNKIPSRIKELQK